MAEPSYRELLGFGPNGWGDDLLWGAWETVQVAACAYAVGIVLGLIGAGAKLIGRRVTFVLSDIYTTQLDVYGDVAGPATHLFIPESFRPDARNETIQLFLWSMIILEGQERFLKEAYERHLPTLRRRIHEAG